MLRPSHDIEELKSPSVWRARRDSAVDKILNLLGLAAMLLASELIIWGLSRTLRPMKLDFFASILGMILVFSLMTAASLIWRSTDRFYDDWLRSKVDFINAHMGLAFPVPIIMLNKGRVPSSRDVARIIGVFVTTNLTSWLCVFIASLALISGVMRLLSKPCLGKKKPTLPSSPTLAEPPSEIAIDTKRCRCEVVSDILPGPFDPEQQTLSSSRDPSPSRPSVRQPSVWKFLESHYPIILPFLGIFIIGVPISAALHDERPVDAFSMCLIWISSLRAQRALKASRFMAAASWPRKALATMLNPVLITVLLMIAYTRLKALAFGTDGLAYVLHSFSCGTPLYALWSSAVKQPPVPVPTPSPAPNLNSNSTPRFGAGDAALAILECGILTWGLKLSQCRRQIFSPAGLAVLALSAAAASANVLLSTLLARAIRLHAPEALSFAARCTTLALAKPATEAVAGNALVNATLVVGNGVLGQLMYPLVLSRLGVAGPAPSTEPEPDSKHGTDLDHRQWVLRDKDASASEEDDPVVIAAGVAIGINGAAMGVSYLYEAKSRAAPYAALAMTVFGVMTVVFTTVEPFKGILITLAGH